MDRPLRLEFAGAPYHVTSRGDGREDIFRAVGAAPDLGAIGTRTQQHIQRDLGSDGLQQRRPQ